MASERQPRTMLMRYLTGLSYFFIVVAVIMGIIFHRTQLLFYCCCSYYGHYFLLHNKRRFNLQDRKKRFTHKLSTPSRNLYQVMNLGPNLYHHDQIK